MTRKVYEPHGIRFFDVTSQRDMLLVTEEGHSAKGWLCYRGPEGQWVSLRKATQEDLDKINSSKREWL